MSYPKIRPFKHRLYVHAYPPPEETQTESGLIIHRRGRERELEAAIRAQILSVGYDCHPSFAPGEWVLIARFSGTAVQHDRLGDPDAAYLVISEDSVICHLDKAETEKELGVQSEID